MMVPRHTDFTMSMIDWASRDTQTHWLHHVDDRLSNRRGSAISRRRGRSRCCLISRDEIHRSLNTSSYLSFSSHLGDDVHQHADDCRSHVRHSIEQHHNRNSFSSKRERERERAVTTRRRRSFTFSFYRAEHWHSANDVRCFWDSNILMASSRLCCWFGLTSDE